MSNSIDLKEEINEWVLEYYEECEIDYDPKLLNKWKRISKKKDDADNVIRVFENKFINKKIMTSNDRILGFVAEQNYAFYILKEKKDETSLDETIVYITDLKYFQDSGYQSDFHITYHVALPFFMDEVAEGIFVSTEDEEVTQKSLIEHGLVFNEDFANFIKEYCF